LAGRSEADALDSGLRALRYRDLSALELRRRLERRDFSAEECEDAVTVLERTGLLDDRRFAESRALALAGRGAGDALIRQALEEAGVAPELIEDALHGLESETARARAIADRRGAGPKTARYLSAKGFADEVVAEVVATTSRDALG
jgi:regulatory protein